MIFIRVLTPMNKRSLQFHPCPCLRGFLGREMPIFGSIVSKTCEMMSVVHCILSQWLVMLLKLERLHMLAPQQRCPTISKMNTNEPSIRSKIKSHYSTNRAIKVSQNGVEQYERVVFGAITANVTVIRC